MEGDLGEEELLANRNDQNIDNANNFFRDDEYYASKEYNLQDVKVPLLSVANWGGILLHLRGNVVGYMSAGSSLKYLRFITGRHDLPFYYPEEIGIQKSFLDAFLKGVDDECWTTGQAPKVSVVLRKGNVGFNNAAAEKAYDRRSENEWPIARTRYTPYYLTPDRQLTSEKPATSTLSKISYHALGTLDKPELVQFSSPAFTGTTEITGHIVARLNVSMNAYIGGSLPKDIDLFLTLRHILPEGEVFYTGTAGDPVPLCKGWLRVSLRKVNTSHRRHRDYLPHRDYLRSDVLPVLPGEVYPVDVEIWPTNVVLESGSRLVLEVSSGDTQGSGLFTHGGEHDR
jgi:predicted acyl esterase